MYFNDFNFLIKYRNKKMEEMNSPNKCISFSILTICILFLIAQINQMVKINKILTSNYSDKQFSNCILPQSLFQITSVIFSILFILCLSFVVISVQYCLDFFLKRMFSPFISLLYLIFGIYLFGCSIYGLFKWDNSIYICVINNPDQKIFSWAYFLPMCLTGLIGTLTVITIISLNTVEIYKDSILKKEGGINFIRLIFWKTVLGEKINIFNRNNRKNNNDRNENEEQENLLINNGD